MPTDMSSMDGCSVGAGDRDRSRKLDGLEKIDYRCHCASSYFVLMIRFVYYTAIFATHTIYIYYIYIATHTTIYIGSKNRCIIHKSYHKHEVG